MRDPAAIKILTGVLEDLKQEPIVRHEAGEALGAIGDPSVIPLLKKYRDDPSPEVAETCELALDRINWLRCNKRRDFPNKYSTVDPAPPMDRLEVIERMREMESTGKMEKTRKQMGKMKVITNDVCFLKTILLDENDSLFNRYKAMFLLRDMDTQKSVQALTKGLKAGSALLRHEVAFVLGQLQNKSTISALRASLENTEEHEMVRHECAEALGAIATPECYAILKKYLDDDKRVVLESCIVALDMCDYENSTEFQYADTLANLATA
ncbi:Deoxyhypusine hydroxylase [Ooceraea biroi]|nr:Deoxyhypusine hydroxylase [Ooceraea biroi]